MIETTIFGLRLVFALLLYLFMFQVVRTVWRELRDMSYASFERTPGDAQLAVLNTPGADPLQGARVALQPLTTIGRSPGNTVLLTDPGVSSQHARLVRRGGQWWLEDLGSTNGTWVNNQRVTRPVALAPGDTFQCARTLLRIE